MEIWLTLLALAVGLLVFWRWKRHNTLQLNWPETLGLHRVSRNVDVYLAHLGWKIEQPLLLAFHQKIAVRGKQRIHIICMPSHVHYNGSKLKDLTHEVVNTRPQPVVCVTVSPAGATATATAAAGQVVLLHYKDLTMFGPRERNTLQDLEAIRRSHLETA